VTIVFLDASALFSAALSATGGSRELLHLGFLGKLCLVISPFVVEETRRNLVLKAPGGLPALEAFLEAAPLTVVDSTLPDVQAAAQFTEPKDAPIVAAAVAAGATYLASFDRAHLVGNTRIEQATGLQIRTPGDILAALQ
jgi:predicted nucleic acid-binding protein